MKKTTFELLLAASMLLPVAGFAQANDNFADAEAVSCGSNYTGTTAAATIDENDAPDGFGADMDAPNVWYSYTGSGSAETITLNLCNSSYDSSVLVYTGTSGSLTLVAGNDDDNTCGVGLTTRSRVSFTSDGTTTYYIAIEGWNATSTGAYTMDVTCDVVNTPVVDNQTCDTALSVNADGSLYDSDNTYGDITPTQPSCDLFGNIQDVWFSFTAPSATVDCIVGLGTMTSANFAVYSGDCFALTGLTCLSNLTVTTTQSLTNLVAGNTYYVQVWSNAAEQGTFNLTLLDPNACKPTVTFTKELDCVNSTFSISADVTGLGTATSVTFADDQASAPQTVSTTGLLTFGPYNFGTSVVITATNDQSPTCVLNSGALTVAACPPANDDCSSAEPITVGTAFADFAMIGTNVSANSTTGLTFNCQTNRKNEVWYSFQVPASGTFTVETDTSAGTAMTDSVLSVFAGTCGALTEVGCDDDSGNGNFSKVAVTGQTPGDTLYIGVWTYGTGNTGEFQLSVYDPTAATNSFDNAHFVYYPNPVDTVLNLNYVKNISSVSVFNLLGQKVMAKASNNLTQVDMSALASGTYLVKVTSDNQVKTFKVSKR